jgi:pimeloyl-ACP methyl ester carboxylesterase
MLNWLIRILGGLLAVLVLAIIASVGLYQHWLTDHERTLNNDSMIVQTVRGPIEYAQIGSGPAVLVSHGTPGGYDGPLAGLRLAHAEQKGLRYIIPSRPGYLRTPIDVGRTPEQQADAFAALLDSLNIQSAAIIAHSGGGPAALQFALRHPERCSALVLEAALVRTPRGPAPLLPSTAFAARVRDILFYVFQGVGIAPYQAKDPSDPLITPLARANLYGVVPYWPRRVGTANDLLQQQQLDDWPLQNITCPTLIAHGTADQAVPLADAQYAHAQIAGSEFVELPGADHMMISGHEKLDESITAFLRAHPKPQGQ